MTQAADDLSVASVGMSEALSVLGTQKAVLQRIVGGASLSSTLEAIVTMIESVSEDGVLASVLLLDDDGTHLRHGAAPSLPAFYNEAIDGIAIGPSVGSCGTAAFRREQVIVADIATDPLWNDFRALALDAGLLACWSTPIAAVDGRVLGTFAMYYPQARRPTAVDLALIDVFVQIAAVAIERCRADEERERALVRERQARQELRFLLDATTRVASSLDFGSTLQRLADLAVPVLADLCFVDVVDGGELRRAAVVGADAGDLAHFPPDLGSDHPVARVVASGEALHVPVVTDEILRSATRPGEHRSLVADLHFESFMCLPLAARGNVFGAMTLVSTRPARRYGDGDLALAQDLATRAALVIDNARLYESTREAERRLSVVVRAGTLLTSSLDLDDVLERLCSLLVPEVGDGCEVYVRTVDNVLRRVGSSPAGTTPLAVAKEVPAAVAEALETGASLHLGRLEPAQVGRVLSPTLAPAGVEAATVVPLVAHGESIGAIAVGQSEQVAATADLGILPVIAGRAALAVDNARLYAAERSVAETLQRSLLPRSLPAVAGLEAAARYRPGGPGVDVGGDWYDVVPLDGGLVGLVIGDVMGRGVVAASVMGQLRNALRGLAVHGLDPAEALGLLDRLLQSEDDCPLATVFVAVADPASRSLLFANAGHVPPLAVRPDGSVEWLDVMPDPPLGASPLPSAFHQSTVDLAPGTTLVLYTDGLVERRRERLDDGLAALAQAASLGVGADLGPEALGAALVEWFADTDREPDDTAVLVARFS